MNNLSDIIRKIKPCDTNNPYIFISYSQHDRDLVWNDVLEFQNQGYNIWLDEKNLDKTNASWKEDALTAIEDMDCALLVFYVSATSLISNACYQELSRTISEITKALHLGPVKFIAIDAELIGDITKFHQKVFEKIKTSPLGKEERKIQALTLNKFINQFFNSNNEKVRIHFKNEKDRKMDYYEEILASFPDETRIHPIKQLAPNNKPTEQPPIKSEITETLQKKIIHEDFLQSGLEKKSIQDSIIKSDDVKKIDIESNKTELLKEEFTNIRDSPSESKNSEEIIEKKKPLIYKSSPIIKPKNPPEISEYFTYYNELPQKTTIEQKYFKKKDMSEADQGNGIYRLNNGYTQLSTGVLGGLIFKGKIDVKIIELPDSITSLHPEEFHDCRNLQKIHLPKYLSAIKSRMFENCSSLTDIIIPGNVTKIYFDAFKGCSSLKKLIFPFKLQELDLSAFADCSSLEELNLPFALKHIGMASFQNCTSLKKLYLSPNLNYMGGWCFDHCSSLQKVIIPGTLEKLDDYVFANCNSLETAYLMDGIKEINKSFIGCGDNLHIRIPDSVTQITSDSFYKTNPIIYCSKTSYAYEYAAKNHFSCIFDTMTEEQIFSNLKKDYINYITNVTNEADNNFKTK